jgi:hypothetical protein
MKMYFVNRIEYSLYSIKGEGVDATATMYEAASTYSDVKGIKGTGGRKIKDLLPKLIRNFVLQETESKRLELKRQGEEFKSKFIESVKSNLTVWQEIENRKLYDVTLNYGHGSQGYKDDTITSGKLMTGKDLKMHINYKDVLSYNAHEISNTALYVLGSGRDYERHVAEDQRIIVSMNTAYVTGLSLKEKLSLGMSFHGRKEHCSNEVVIDNARKFANGQTVSLFARSREQEQQQGANMYDRLLSELERAEKTPEEKEIFNTTDTAIVEIYTAYDTFYFGETYSSIGDAAIDKTVEIKINEGDYIEGFYTGLFVELRGNLYNLYHPTENKGNPRNAGR